METLYQAAVFLVMICVSVQTDVAVNVSYEATPENMRRFIFTSTQFEEFSTCLCQGTSLSCYASYSTAVIYNVPVTNVSKTGNWSPNSESCKYYKCSNSRSNNALICTQQVNQVQSSCYLHQIIVVDIMSKCNKICVTLIWNLSQEGIDQNTLSMDTSQCSGNCVCAPLLTTAVASLDSSLPSFQTQTTTKTTIVNQQNETVWDFSSAWDNNTVTSPHQSSPDEDQDDKTYIVIAVVIPVIIIIILIIICLFFWRRRKQKINRKKVIEKNVNEPVSVEDVNEDTPTPIYDLAKSTEDPSMTTYNTESSKNGYKNEGKIKCATHHMFSGDVTNEITSAKDKKTANVPLASNNFKNISSPTTVNKYVKTQDVECFKEETKIQSSNSGFRTKENNKNINDKTDCEEYSDVCKIATENIDDDYSYIRNEDVQTIKENRTTNTDLSTRNTSDINDSNTENDYTDINDDEIPKKKYNIGTTKTFTSDKSSRESTGPENDYYSIDSQIEITGSRVNRINSYTEVDIENSDNHICNQSDETYLEEVKPVLISVSGSGIDNRCKGIIDSDFRRNDRSDNDSMKINESLIQCHLLDENYSSFKDAITANFNKEQMKVYSKLGEEVTEMKNPYNILLQPKKDPKLRKPLPHPSVNPNNQEIYSMTGSLNENQPKAEVSGLNTTLPQRPHLSSIPGQTKPEQTANSKLDRVNIGNEMKSSNVNSKTYSKTTSADNAILLPDAGNTPFQEAASFAPKKTSILSEPQCRKYTNSSSAALGVIPENCVNDADISQEYPTKIRRSVSQERHTVDTQSTTLDCNINHTSVDLENPSESGISKKK